MESKYVKCPKCKAVLLVKNSAGEKLKRFTCPRCKTGLQISFEIKEENHGRPVPDTSKTEAAAPPARRSRFFFLTCNGTTYRLQPGTNTIGRRSEGSQASVKIASSDVYMSRNHATVRVFPLSDGTLGATISNSKNKNATLLNGKELQPGDEIFLNDGDQITMGQTVLYFATI